MIFGGTDVEQAARIQIVIASTTLSCIVAKNFVCGFASISEQYIRSIYIDTHPHVVRAAMSCVEHFLQREAQIDNVSPSVHSALLSGGGKYDAKLSRLR